MSRPVRLALVLAAPLLVAATPLALRGVAPGLWEIGTSADGHGAQRRCLADVGLLAQWQEQGANCTRVVLADSARGMSVQYNCPSGHFGRTDIQAITPRTLRVATQGIGADGPFNYVLHARRVADCG